jgi:hypothetical protein
MILDFDPPNIHIDFLIGQSVGNSTVVIEQRMGSNSDDAFFINSVLSIQNMIRESGIPSGLEIGRAVIPFCIAWISILLGYFTKSLAHLI